MPGDLTVVRSSMMVILVVCSYTLEASTGMASEGKGVCEFVCGGWSGRLSSLKMWIKGF